MLNSANRLYAVDHRSWEHNRQMDDRFGSAWIGKFKWPAVLINVVLLALIYVQIPQRTTLFMKPSDPPCLNHNT